MNQRLEIDFVAYLGDPESGASAAASQELLRDGADRSGIEWPGAAGAITVRREGKDLIERLPEPIFKLVSHMVRAVHSLIEGESETVEYMESEHGFLFEPSGEDVMVSFFSGNAFEPEEYLLAEAQTPLESFAEQIIGMGERLRDLVKLTDPGLFDRDEYTQSLLEFLEMSTETFKTFKLARERGLR